MVIYNLYELIFITFTIYFVTKDAVTSSDYFIVFFCLFREINLSAGKAFNGGRVGSLRLIPPLDLRGFIKSSTTLHPKTKATVRTVTIRPNVLTSQSSKSNSPNATIYSVSPMEPARMYNIIKESTVFTLVKGNPDVGTTNTKTKEEPIITTEDKSVLTTTEQETTTTTASKTNGNNVSTRDVSVVKTDSTSAMTKAITAPQSATVTEKPATYTLDVTTTATSKTTKNPLAGCKNLLVPFPDSYGFGIKPESYLQFSVNKGSLQTRYVLS